MTIKSLIKKLEQFNPNAQIYISGDEELNDVYTGIDISTNTFGGESIKEGYTVLLFPLSNTLK